MWHMICACVLSILGVNLWSSSWSTFIFAPWLILMSWRPYCYLHYASFLQDIITNISIHHDHIKFLLEYHIGHHFLVLINHSLKILIHHGSTHKPWCMHNNMYMSFISNPFYLLLASPGNKHPSVHPIFFMHWKWNFPSNVQPNANISPLGLSFNYQNHKWGLHVLSIALSILLSLLLPYLLIRQKEDMLSLGRR